MTTRTIALLPMKANSERIKEKNFRPIAGKPLFRWILDTLLEVEEINEIVINTDARHILKEHGIESTDRIRIRERKEELCGDFTSMNLILADDIAACEADLYVMTHATNPMLSTASIKKAIAQLLDNTEKDSLFTVNKVQTRFYREDGSPVNHDPDNLIRTQDLEPWFEENSCLYLFSRESFQKTNARIGAQPMMMETPPLESLDIDEPHDRDIVAALLESRLK